MKRHGSDGYIVRRLSGNGGLCTNPKSELSIEVTRELIDDRNKRAVERGYKAEQFLICYYELVNWYDDSDERFIKSEYNVQAIEVYPATL